MQARATLNRITGNGGPRKRLSLAARAAAIYASALAAGVIAASYNYSDLTTLYQDPFAQTPVNTTEQPIGYVVDQSQGGPKRGPNIAKNGNFESDTVWIKGAGWSIANGRATRIATGTGNTISQPYVFTAGKVYEITFDYFNLTATGVAAVLRGGTTVVATHGITAANGTGFGTYRGIAVARTGNTSFDVTFGGASDAGSIANFQIRELIGVNAWTGTPAVKDANWTDNGDGSYTSNAANGFLGWSTTTPMLTVGKTYEVVCRVSARTAGALALPYDGAGANNAAQATGAGTFRRVFTATTTALYIYSLAFAGTVDFLYVTEMPGTHVNQATSTARPYTDGRVNQIIQTEAISNAAWSKVGAGTGTAPVVTDNFAVAPDGTTTAARVQMALNGGTTTADQSVISQTVSGINPNAILSSGVWLKTNDGTTKLVTMRDDLASPAVAPILSVTGTWQFFSTENRTTQAGATNSASVKLWLRGAQGTSDSADLLMWHPQFEFAPALGKYQKVATGDVYDWGFPLTARFDGVDDALVQTVASFNLSNTPVITGFISMRITGTGYANPLNQGPTGTADGNWGMTINDVAASGQTLLYRRGNGTQQYKQVASTLGVPRTALLAFSIDASDVAANSGLTLIGEGAPVIAGTGAAQTVRTGFTTDPLQIGRRGAATQPFKGNISRIDFIARRLSPDDMYVFQRLGRQQLTGYQL